MGPKNETQFQAYSYGYAIGNGLAEYAHVLWFTPGFGWGFSRKAYDALGGIYDLCIAGSSDLVMARIFSGLSSKDINEDKKISEPFRKSYDDFGWKFRNLSEDLKVGYPNVSIKHYYHGKFGKRYYNERYKILEEDSFNPYTDLYRNEYGIYQVKATKTRVIERMKEYFTSREEDSVDEEDDTTPMFQARETFDEIH